MRSILRSALVLAILIVVLNASLLAFGYFSAGAEHVFGGLIYNPLDGNSYLAKMRLGFQGDWRFTLPYECEAGTGGYIYLYYLFLGHLSAWLGVSIPFIYHFSRIFNAIILIFTLAIFFEKLIPDQRWASRALWLSILGSGLGWLALPFNKVTMDMILAEGYPYLSILANPHFPLGLAIFIGILMATLLPDSGTNCWLVAGFCLLLAIVQPFLLVSIYLLWIIFTIFCMITRKRVLLRRIILGLVAGLPYLVYQLWIMHSDPFLSRWSSQNITPAPPIWDLLLSLSPVLIMTVYTLINLRKIKGDYKILIAAWFFMTLLVAYLPFDLQRRFMAGIYVACASLMFLGLSILIKRQSLSIKIYRIFLALSIPGSFIITVVLISGIISKAPSLFLSRSESIALNWLDDNSSHGSLILASPELGGFIPARIDNCVLYGHPFESIDAEEKENLLNAFFSHGAVDTLMPVISGAGTEIYLFYGPRERALGNLPDGVKLEAVFTEKDVTIYKLDMD